MAVLNLRGLALHAYTVNEVSLHNITTCLKHSDLISGQIINRLRRTEVSNRVSFSVCLSAVLSSLKFECVDCFSEEVFRWFINLYSFQHTRFSSIAD